MFVICVCKLAEIAAVSVFPIQSLDCAEVKWKYSPACPPCNPLNALWLLAGVIPVVTEFAFIKATASNPPPSVTTLPGLDLYLKESLYKNTNSANGNPVKSKLDTVSPCARGRVLYHA
jgi:hypothetical protein